MFRVAHALVPSSPYAYATRKMPTKSETLVHLVNVEVMASMR
jgi:hypothetical protein